MRNIIIEFINDGFVDAYLNNEQKQYLIEIIKNIKETKLYVSPFHGLHHSQKVLLNEFLIGLNEKLDDIDMQIIIDAAIYHDSGRENDFEEKFHGLASANKLVKIVDNPIYQDKENLEILKAICDVHSRDDMFLSQTFYNYEIDEKNYERYLKLASILKDADALDRKRFNKTSIAALKEKYLRSDFSKTLIPLADKINLYYRNKISQHYFIKYAKDFTGENNIICSHGIGFNFFRLNGILKNGILSNYAKKQKGYNNTRNFYGNNNELWISATYEKGKAYELFVNNGISFDVLVPKFIKGIKNSSKARSEGLPIDSGLYDDEVFLFNEIKPENIISINFSLDRLNQNIDTLNYLNVSGNIDSLNSIVKEYAQNIRMYCNYYPNVRETYELLKQYEQLVIGYEKLNKNEQQNNQKIFFDYCDEIIAKINKVIQKWMKEAFCLKFDKENVTVNDIICYMLNENNIEYNYENGKFILNQEIKRL